MFISKLKNHSFCSVLWKTACDSYSYRITAFDPYYVFSPIWITFLFGSKKLQTSGLQDHSFFPVFSNATIAFLSHLLICENPAFFLYLFCENPVICSSRFFKNTVNTPASPVVPASGVSALSNLNRVWNCVEQANKIWKQHKIIKPKVLK
jgi:hypothetical protein